MSEEIKFEKLQTECYPILKSWLTEEEFKEIFYKKDILECIEECTSPSKELIFNAFEGLEPENVKVLIIGQDPYPNSNKAHGMAFSYKPNYKIQSKDKNDSLCYIFDKLGLNIEKDCTDLTCWRKQGVLLLNTALTYNKGTTLTKRINVWRPFVDCIINKLIDCDRDKQSCLVVFLWGVKANKLSKFKKDVFLKEDLHDENLKRPNILILRSSHPSQ